MADSYRAQLNELTTQELEQIIYDSYFDDDADWDMVSQALELLVLRAPSEWTGAELDQEAFLHSLSLPESAEGGRSCAPAHLDVVPTGRKPGKARTGRSVLRSILKFAATAAAVLCITFGGMIAAYSCGVDVFGAIAHWSEDVFHFNFGETEDASSWTDSAELANTELLPTWIPERYHFIAQYEEDKRSYSQTQTCFESETGSFLIERYVYNSVDAHTSAEKDGQILEVYSSNGRTFYLFSNSNQTVATCMDGLTQLSIVGDLTTEELKQMVDSIP